MLQAHLRKPVWVVNRPANVGIKGILEKLDTQCATIRSFTLKGKPNGTVIIRLEDISYFFVDDPELLKASLIYQMEHVELDSKYLGNIPGKIAQEDPLNKNSDA